MDGASAAVGGVSFSRFVKPSLVPRNFRSFLLAFFSFEFDGGPAVVVVSCWRRS